MSLGRAWGWTLALGWVLAVAGPAGAQDIASRLAACGACHGAAGQSVLPGIPSLAGQPRVFLENQLVLIREGMRSIPAMQGVMDGVSDAEITAISRHYAAQPLRAAGTTRDAVRFPQGEKLAREARCGTCHLPDYVGREQMPRLAGQREDYLLHSMRQFVSNQAVGRDTLMNAALHGISDAELQSIAHYLSRLAP